MQLDVSAAGLIAEALKHGMGPADDWTDYQQRHRWETVARSVVMQSRGWWWRLQGCGGAFVAVLGPT